MGQTTLDAAWQIEQVATSDYSLERPQKVPKTPSVANAVNILQACIYKSVKIAYF